MAQRPANGAPAPAKPVHVGLVAGGKTLEHLGPVVRHLVVGLLDEPMHVTMVYPSGEDVADIPGPPVRMIPYEASRVPLLGGRAAKAAAEGLKLANLSLLHALDEDALSLTQALAEEIGRDYVLSVLSLNWNGRISDPRCRVVLAGSEPVRQRLLSARAAPPDMIRLQRPGVHRAGKATCFIDPKHAPAIVAAGDLHSVEPFAAVVEAFALLQAAKRDCVFFLVGAGRGEGPVRRLAEEAGLMGELTFVDRQSPEQLTGILRAADIFISPTGSDRVEIQLLSAMAAGVPVLTADAEASDFIIPDQTALTFKIGQADELAAKLVALLDDRAAARSLAERALALLRENHSPAKMAGQLADLYRSLTGGKPPPA